MNCFEKLNPAERLILESVCTDCKPTTTLTYRWSLLAKNSASLETEVAGFAVKTTTGISQANVALKENVLDPGKEYSLKISAWKPGGETGKRLNAYRKSSTYSKNPRTKPKMWQVSLIRFLYIEYLVGN